MFLLDTAIVFDLRRARSPDAEQGLVLWAAGVARERLFLSALSVLELDAAATQAARRDKAAGGALRSWIDERVIPAFDGNILPLDTAVARRRGQVALADMRDALFVATALEHRLTLVTRTTAKFKGARIKLFDPTGYRPDEVADDADWRTAGRDGAVWLRNLFVRS
ncbi:MULTISPECIES: PIN domain-containing protein [Sphingomonas]|jgi:predicted nucleic acid-binding protein|uniref:PIN domain-containing protein n=1 Tax=Sphingomonas TaxID=13687 RepID=UPI001AE88A8D